MLEYFFSQIRPQRPRSHKPRSQGFTMVIDWGIGLARQEDLLATAAGFFDLAKIAVGISGLLPAELLAAKIQAYRQHDVEPFPGGQFLEFAEVHGYTDGYLATCVEAGYRWVEVSDNLAPVSLAWKQELIRQAVQQYHLDVLGEVGKKEGLTGKVSLVDDAKACLDAGAKLILLEAAELVSDDAAPVEEVISAIGPERVMFELPGPWIDGVHACDIHRMRKRLIERFGPDVNLGNCAPDELVSLEAFRRGLGVNAGGDTHPQTG